MHKVISKSATFSSDMHIPQDIYAKIVSLMPISCVDLLVEDESGMILMIKRANEPAKGQWWFPGGRVHFLEMREQAARRKLKEECGLEPRQMKEMGTYDVFLDMPDDGTQSHGITTLFHMKVGQQRYVILDAQSLEYEWHRPDQWISMKLHAFIRQGISIITKRSDDINVR